MHECDLTLLLEKVEVLTSLKAEIAMVESFKDYSKKIINKQIKESKNITNSLMYFTGKIEINKKTDEKLKTLYSELTKAELEFKEMLSNNCRDA